MASLTNTIKTKEGVSKPVQSIEGLLGFGVQPAISWRKD